MAFSDDFPVLEDLLEVDYSLLDDDFVLTGPPVNLVPPFPREDPGELTVPAVGEQAGGACDSVGDSDLGPADETLFGQSSGSDLGSDSSPSSPPDVLVVPAVSEGSPPLVSIIPEVSCVPCVSEGPSFVELTTSAASLALVTSVEPSSTVVTSVEPSSTVKTSVEPSSTTSAGEIPSAVAGTASHFKHIKFVGFPTNKVCPVCNETFIGLYKRHVRNHHLPWYFLPELSCFQCRVAPGSICFLDAQHRQQPDHSDGSCNFNDLQLGGWVARMTGILYHFSEFFQVSLTDLLVFCQGLGLVMPHNLPLSPTHVILYNILEIFLGLEPTVDFSFSPMNSIICLLHWTIVPQLLLTFPVEARREFASLDVMRGCDGRGLSTDEFHRLRAFSNQFSFFVDSYMHLSLALTKFRYPLLDDLLYRTGDREYSLKFLIASFVMPDSWSSHVPFLKDDRVFFSFGIHPSFCWEISLRLCHFRKGLLVS